MSGRSSVPRCCGTSSRSRPTRPSPSSSGTSGWSPTSAPCATAPSRSSPQYFYGILSLGWRGSARHWMRYETASLLLAGLATPLVLSVHTVISFDFAVADAAGLAHHDLPAILRRRRDLFRLRHGADAGHSDPEVLPPGRSDHDSPHRQHGQGHAGHRAASSPTATRWKSSWRGTRPATGNSS